MTHNNYIYILVVAVVTYLIRVLPLTLIRREIKNRFLRSFLYYVPYVTLAAMRVKAAYWPAEALTKKLVSVAWKADNPAFRAVMPMVKATAK